MCIRDRFDCIAEGCTVLLPNLAHSDMCEQLQMNNQSLTGDPVGAEVCRRSRLGTANDMCGIASPRMFTFRESENIFGAGKSVLFSFFIGILKGCIFLQLVILLVFAQFFCGLSKRMYYTTLVIPLVFVYFPKHFPFKENHFILCLL